jgi:hypothetical protein
MAQFESVLTSKRDEVDSGGPKKQILKANRGGWKINVNSIIKSLLFPYFHKGTVMSGGRRQ